MAKQKTYSKQEVNNAKELAKTIDLILGTEEKRAKMSNRQLQDLVKSRAKAQEILDVEKERNAEADKAADKRKKEKEDLSEVQNLGKDILKLMKEQGVEDTKRGDFRDNWLDVSKEMEKAAKRTGTIEKKRFTTAKGGLMTMEDIYHAASDIGTEEFQSYDLSKQIAAAKKLGMNAYAKELEITQKINDANKRKHEQITAAGEAIVAPFEKLDSIVRQIPMGNLLADVIGIKQMGEKIGKGFKDWIGGKLTAGPEVPDKSKAATPKVTPEVPDKSKAATPKVTKDKAGKLRMAKGEKGAGSFAKAPDISKEAGEAGEDGGEEMKKGVERKFDAKRFGKILGVGLIGGLVVTIGLLGKALLGTFKSAMAFQKEMGIGAGHGIDLSLSTKEAAAGAFIYGENMEDVRARASELVKEWGDVNSVTEKEISLANELERTYGTSAGAVAQLTAMMESTSSASKEILMKDMAEEMKDMQKSGVPVGVVMEEIAGNTDFFAKHMKKGGKNVMKAAAFAKKLGMSMDTIAGAADSLLDVESSINAEMEASVLLGRSVNMDEARRLALAGDLEGMQRAIMNQVGSEADYLEMNVIQRQALAEAAGLSVTDLSKMVSSQEKLANMSAEDTKANEKKAATTAKIKKVWEKIVSIFKNLYQRLVTPMTKAFMKLFGITGDLASDDGLGGVAELGDKITAWLEPMIIKFEGWLAGTNKEGGSFAELMVGIKDTAKTLTGILKKITTFLFEHQEIVAVLAGGWVANKLGLLSFVKGAIMGIGKLIGQYTAAWVAKKLMAKQPLEDSTGGGMNPAKMMAAGVAMVLFAGAIWIMAKAMQQFSTGVSWEGVAMGLVTLAALTIAGIALGLSAPVTIVGAAAMVILAAAFVVMSIGAIGFAYALSLLTPLLTAFFDGIALIISAIAGAFVKMLTAVAETFERLAKIGGGQLLGTAAGILAIAAALLVFGGGSLLGGIASGLGAMFGGDPVKKFERFAAMAPGLLITAKSMEILSKGMKTITSMDLDDVIDPLQSFAGALLMAAFIPVRKFERLGAIAPQLNMTAIAMEMLSKSMRELQSINLGKLVDPTLKLASAFQDLASAAREVNRATVASMAMGVVSTIGSAIQGTVANIASLIGITEQKKESKIVTDPVTAAKLDKVITLLSAMPTDEKQITRSRKEILAIGEAFANK